MDKTDAQQRNIWLTVVVLIGAMTLIVGLFVRQFIAPSHLDNAWLKVHGTVLFDTPRHFDPVKLLDHHGKAFTNERFRGSWSIVYFGFTFCPDVCPTTLALLHQVNEVLAASRGKDPTINVYMVSVDPARDTPAKLASYLSYFDPAFTGLTGEFLDIHRFATQLNVPIQKQPGSGENYSVDHGANLVLLNPQGDYAGFVTPPFDKQRLVQLFEVLRRRS